MAQCPYCEEDVEMASIERVVLQASNSMQFDGLSYSCQSCNKVLSAGFDAARMVDDIVGKLRQ